MTDCHFTTACHTGGAYADRYLFRLPEEKRARILEGAWSEFTAVPYAEASINRIVQTSRIPRGSFYQYFEDKNDLFLTLIDEIRDQFLDLFHDTLERSGGDLFAMPLALLDAMVAPSGCITPAFSRAFALLSLNVNMDVQQLFFERAAGELCPQKLLEHIDPTLLRTQEDGFVDDVFTLLVGALACAIARTLKKPESFALERERMRGRIEIIKTAALPYPKEDTANEEKMDGSAARPRHALSAGGRRAGR